MTPTTKLITLSLALATLVGCSRDADIASRNLSYGADSFKINRRVVFYNGINGEYILSIEGLCSIGNDDKAKELSVTCKVGPEAFKKHFLGLSDNVTYFAEQLDGAKVDLYHYKVIFKPASIVPSIDLRP